MTGTPAAPARTPPQTHTTRPTPRQAPSNPQPPPHTPPIPPPPCPPPPTPPTPQDLKERVFGKTDAAAAMGTILARDPGFDMSRLLAGVKKDAPLVRRPDHPLLISISMSIWGGVT